MPLYPSSTKVHLTFLQRYTASAAGIFYRIDIALAEIATLLYFKLCLSVLLDSEIAFSEIAALLYYIVGKCTVR